MKLIRSIHSALIPKNGCVLTIGNFDAVHIGHQQIIKRLGVQAQKMGLPLVLMTFDPHPEEFFLGEKTSPRLTNSSSRYFALRDLGVDIMLSLPFNKSLAATSATDFIQDFLVKGLNVKYLLVGDDFRFGKDRGGDFTILQQHGSSSGYEVANSSTILFGNQRVSSTRIKRLLAQGELKQASELLGRRYNMVGRVNYGQQLGRQWGFPTLNLAVTHSPALTGVYAVEVFGLSSQGLPGVANLGTRPTVSGLRTLLEVHLFEFDQEIYGRRICVEFVEKIRDEKKFNSFDDLKSQIKRDVQTARSILEGV